MAQVVHDMHADLEDPLCKERAKPVMAVKGEHRRVGPENNGDETTRRELIAVGDSVAVSSALFLNFTPPDSDLRRTDGMDLDAMRWGVDRWRESMACGREDGGPQEGRS
jgi:hypothetical protein